jgi:putative transposase
MSRNIVFAPNSYYHIYDRGTESRIIFNNDNDYERFLALIYVCNDIEPVRIENVSRSKAEQGLTLLSKTLKIKRTQPLIDICSYCLMPNHFHFILREREDGGISRFMQKIMTAYTMYFNKKYERSGSLFQGTFKATAADTDNYLKYLISYIHLNPVKLIDPTWKENGIKNRSESEEFLKKYRYSSYLDYSGIDRLEKVLIDMSSLPQYFESPYGFESAVTEWLELNNLSKV